MPINIPTYGNYQVTEHDSPTFASGINVPTQTTDYGRAINRAAAKINAWADKLQEDQDNAIVDSALADLRRKRIDSQYNPDTGFNGLQGENALVPRNEDGTVAEAGKGGVSLIDARDKMLRDYGTSLTEKMTEKQRKMFDKHALNIYNDHHQAVSNHVLMQSLKHQESVARASLDTFVDGASVIAQTPEPEKAYQEDLEGMDKQLKRLAEINGWDATMLAQAKQSYTSKYNTNVVVEMLQQARDGGGLASAKEADAWLKSHSKEFTPEQLTRVRTMVDNHLDAIHVNEIADKAYLLNNYNAYVPTGGVPGVSGVQGAALVNRDGDTAWSITAVLHDHGRTVGETKGADGKTHVGLITAENGGSTAFGLTESDYAQYIKDTGARKPDGTAYTAKELQRACTTDSNIAISVGSFKARELTSRFGGDALKATAAMTMGAEAVDKLVDKYGDKWREHLTNEGVKKNVRSVERRQNEYSESTMRAQYSQGGRITQLTVNDLHKRPTLEDAQRAVNAVDRALKESKPELYDRAVSKTLSRMNAHYEELNQASNERIARALDVLYKVGGDYDNIPVAVTSRLNKGERAIVQQESYRAQAKMRVTIDPARFEMHLTDDNYIRGMTEDARDAYMASLSPNDAKRLLAKWDAVHMKDATLQNAVKTAQESALTRALTGEASPYIAKVNTQVLDRVLTQGQGDKSWAKAKKENSDAYYAMRNEVAESLATALDLGQISEADLGNDVAVHRFLSKMGMFDVTATTDGYKELMKVTEADTPNVRVTGASALVDNVVMADRKARGANMSVPISKAERQQAVSRILYRPNLMNKLLDYLDERSYLSQEQYQALEAEYGNRGQAFVFRAYFIQSLNKR